MGLHKLQLCVFTLHGSFITLLLSQGGSKIHFLCYFYNIKAPKLRLSLLYKPIKSPAGVHVICILLLIIQSCRQGTPSPVLVKKSVVG